MPITDHLKDFVPDLEKYKVVQFFFLCRKIENMKTTYFFDTFTS